MQKVWKNDADQPTRVVKKNELNKIKLCVLCIVYCVVQWERKLLPFAISFVLVTTS